MENWIDDMCRRYPALESCRTDMELAVAQLCAAYERGGKLLVCGNGGSCADGEHIAGELMKGFLKKRPFPKELKDSMQRRCPAFAHVSEQLQMGLPVISLNNHAALNSAFANDVDSRLIYAQQVVALGRETDVFLGISTSGNAENVLAAAGTAKGLGLTVIGLTGRSGGRLKSLADICLCAPAQETYQVQEYHLPMYHALCAQVEEHFFPI